ncbi:hypothetical protein RIF29_27754 [Crotalaria pallida]|uniref:Uncharacterized protein n=1 Tax=Crotalaria pallida TaxID=3830 RepID=A0AAN9I0R2_CROPI
MKSSKCEVIESRSTSRFRTWHGTSEEARLKNEKVTLEGVQSKLKLGFKQMLNILHSEHIPNSILLDVFLKVKAQEHRPQFMLDIVTAVSH